MRITRSEDSDTTVRVELHGGGSAQVPTIQAFHKLLVDVQSLRETVVLLVEQRKAQLEQDLEAS